MRNRHVAQDTGPQPVCSDVATASIAFADQARLREASLQCVAQVRAPDVWEVRADGVVEHARQQLSLQSL